MSARCQYPRIALVAYEAWPKGRVFVRVPNEAGRYMLTDKCVVEIGCPVCKATKGEPCYNPSNGNYWVGTHADRRMARDGRHYPGQPHPKPVLRAADIDHNGEPK